MRLGLWLLDVLQMVWKRAMCLLIVCWWTCEMDVRQCMMFKTILAADFFISGGGHLSSCNNCVSALGHM